MPSSNASNAPARPKLLAQIGAVARGEAAPQGLLARPAPASGRPGPAARVPLDQIRDNPFQHRVDFDEAGLAALAEGIRAQGLIEPVVLRPAADGSYQLIDGWRRTTAYRRLREGAKASERERWGAIPAVVREATDEEMALLALQANLQREDPSPLDVAAGLHRLQKDFGYTHERIARELGLEPKRVQRLLRLQAAPEPIRAAVGQGLALPGEEGRRRLDHIAALEVLRLYNHLHKAEGEARALERAEALAQRALREDWGLRRVQAEVDGLCKGKPKAPKAKAGAPLYQRTARGFSLDLARAQKASAKERAEAIAQLKELIKLLGESKG